VLILPMLLGAFQPPSPHRPGSLGPSTKNLPVPCKCVSQRILLSGFARRKAPSSMGKISTAEVLRLRATSSVSRDKSVRRSAQDDDSVRVLTTNTLNKSALMGNGSGPAPESDLWLPQDCIVSWINFSRPSPDSI
jgi:hypothetical protein